VGVTARLIKFIIIAIVQANKQTNIQTNSQTQKQTNKQSSKYIYIVRGVSMWTGTKTQLGKHIKMK